MKTSKATKDCQAVPSISLWSTDRIVARAKVDLSVKPKARLSLRGFIDVGKVKGLESEKIFTKEFLAESHRIYASQSERETLKIRALSKGLLNSFKKELLDAQNLPNLG